VKDGIADLKRELKELRLTHMAAILEDELAWATKERPSYTELVGRLVSKQLTRRREHARDRRLKAAGLPEAKRVEDYNFAFPDKIDARLVRELATLRFVQAKESVWIAGTPGTGKTHIATALGLRAVEVGYSVRYSSLAAIARRLHAAIADHSEEACLKGLDRIDVLIAEDLGFANIPQEALSLLFELFNRRYERRSTIVTSNLGVEAAEKSLGQQAVASAILDRLLHHAHVVTITGPSFRAEHRLNKRRAEPAARADT